MADELTPDVETRFRKRIIAAGVGVLTIVWVACAAAAASVLVDRGWPAVALTLVGSSLVLYFLYASRTRSLSLASERMAEQHRQLSEAHEAMRWMNEQALRQEKLSSLGMLAAGIAHEINNPMSYVTANVRDLMSEIDANPGCRAALGEYVEDVLPATLDGIRRVNTIVADLRRFSRGDSDQSAAGDYDLNEQVEAALRILHGKIRDHCRTELRLGQVPPVRGRHNQMVELVINLVLNACEAVPRGGLIEIETRSDDDAVFLTVRDDGPGMSPEVAARIFQPFFTTKATGKGTGLGLPVVQGIVDAHGGRIQVDSTPGAGTAIVIRLPAAATVARLSRPLALLAS